MLQEAGYTFTFLSDPKLEAIRRYDLVHASDDPTLPVISGRTDADIARPAEFLIDPSGTIRWRMVTENIRSSQFRRETDAIFSSMKIFWAALYRRLSEPVTVQ